MNSLCFDYVTSTISDIVFLYFDVFKVCSICFIPVFIFMSFRLLENYLGSCLAKQLVFLFVI